MENENWTIKPVYMQAGETESCENNKNTLNN